MENFKIHFAKAVTDNHKRAGTLKGIGIENEVQELVSKGQEETDTLAHIQMQQLETVEALQAQLAVLENLIHHSNSAHIPSVITPPVAFSDDMSQITNMLQVIIAAQ